MINDQDKKTLADAARGAIKNAYAPYSKFQVGAAVLLSDGTIFTGCNVENASYGATACAERVAIFNAVASGKFKPNQPNQPNTSDPKNPSQPNQPDSPSITAIAVITSSDEIATPCGLCRQVIAEFAPKTPILCLSQTGAEKIFTIGELLPFAFELNPLS